MPTSPTKPPEAPVKPPTRMPTFIVDLIVKYATDAAPTLGGAAAKSLSGLMVRMKQTELSAIEQAHVTGVVVMAVTRLAENMKSRL